MISKKRIIGIGFIVASPLISFAILIYLITNGAFLAIFGKEMDK